jgi:hypothetical protein
MIKYIVFLLIMIFTLKADNILDIIEKSKYQLSDRKSVDISFNDIFSNQNPIFAINNINSYSLITLNQNRFEGITYTKDDIGEFLLESEWSNIVDGANSSAKELALKWSSDTTNGYHYGALEIINAHRVKIDGQRDFIEIVLLYKDRDWKLNQDITNQNFKTIIEYKNSLTNPNSVYVIDNFMLGISSSSSTSGEIVEAIYDGYREVCDGECFTMPLIVRSRNILGTWTLLENQLAMNLKNKKYKFKIENSKAYEKYDKYITITLDLKRENLESYLSKKFIR